MLELPENGIRNKGNGKKLSTSQKEQGSVPECTEDAKHGNIETQTAHRKKQKNAMI